MNRTSLTETVTADIPELMRYSSTRYIVQHMANTAFVKLVVFQSPNWTFPQTILF
jgi:hypothetical protein